MSYRPSGSSQIRTSTSELSTYMMRRPHSSSTRRGERIQIKSYSQPLRSYQSSKLSLSEEFAKIPALVSGQTDLKLELASLNDKLAQYIAKVKSLEEQKRVLETRIVELKSSKCGGDGSIAVYEKAIEKWQSQILALGHDKDKLEIALIHYEEDLNDTRQRLEEEIAKRGIAENEAQEKQKFLDDLALEMRDKDRDINKLEENYNLLKEASDANAAALSSERIVTTHQSTFESAPGQDDSELVARLQEIRDSYVQNAANVKPQVVVTLKMHVSDLEDKLKKANEEVMAGKSEIADLHQTLQGYEANNERLQNAHSSLEDSYASLQDMMERERVMNNDKIRELEENWRIAKAELLEYVEQYNSVMNTKEACALELATYRTLLEGEENRIHGKSTSGSMSQQYRIRETFEEISEMRVEKETDRRIMEKDVIILKPPYRGPVTENEDNDLATEDRDSEEDSIPPSRSESNKNSDSEHY